MATITRSIPRKSLSALQCLKSTNNGASWSVLTHTVDAVKNEVTFDAAPTDIIVFHYQAFAKQTKPSTNAVVYGWQSGIGGVFASSRSNKDDAVLLCESAIGKVMVNESAPYSERLTFTGSRFNSVGVISQYPADGRHDPITIANPNNGPIGFKALNYNVATNQQGFINYAYTELKHNGTNWGDDSKVTIVDNQSTKTDLNGNTVLVGTAQTCESLGWIKNKL